MLVVRIYEKDADRIVIVPVQDDKSSGAAQRVATFEIGCYPRAAVMVYGGKTGVKGRASTFARRRMTVSVRTAVAAL